MDPEAYRCPKCHIYFCFKCRARIAEREPQFQCADQSCPCYGKLLCGACTVMVPVFGYVSRTVVEEYGRTVTQGHDRAFLAYIIPVPAAIALGAVLSNFKSVDSDTRFGLAFLAIFPIFLLTRAILRSAGWWEAKTTFIRVCSIITGYCY
jgi:hypothetical protein